MSADPDRPSYEPEILVTPAMAQAGARELNRNDEFWDESTERRAERIYRAMFRASFGQKGKITREMIKRGASVLLDEGDVLHLCQTTAEIFAEVVLRAAIEP